MFARAAPPFQSRKGGAHSERRGPRRSKRPRLLISNFNERLFLQHRSAKARGRGVWKTAGVRALRVGRRPQSLAMTGMGVGDVPLHKELVVGISRAASSPFVAPCSLRRCDWYLRDPRRPAPAMRERKAPHQRLRNRAPQLRRDFFAETGELAVGRSWSALKVQEWCRVEGRVVLGLLSVSLREVHMVD